MTGARKTGPRKAGPRVDPIPVLRALAKGAGTVSRIAAATGDNHHTTYRRLQLLRAQGLVIDTVRKGSGGSIWGITEAGGEALTEAARASKVNQAAVARAGKAKKVRKVRKARRTRKVTRKTGARKTGARRASRNGRVDQDLLTELAIGMLVGGEDQTRSDFLQVLAFAHAHAEGTFDHAVISQAVRRLMLAFGAEVRAQEVRR